MNKTTAIIMVLVSTGLGARAGAAKKQTNRQVMDHFFEVVDSKQIEKLGEVDAPDLIMATPMGVVHGPEGHGQLLKGFAMAFPNFKHTNSACVESGDLISCEGKFAGDHTGPMMMPDGKSVAATQKHVEFGYAGVARIKGGKVAELHVYFDVMTFMQQLGLVPPPIKAASK